MEQFSIKNLCTGYGDSRIGGRMENQDSFGRMETDRGFLILVCDGMGGGPGGKTASSIAVKEIMKGIEEADKHLANREALVNAIIRANMAIYQKGVEIPQLKGMGSTVVALLISQTSATIAHVGDSRVYQARKGVKIFRTFDHSLVFEMVKQKIITEEQARLSAQSNIITRALGIKPDVEVEIDERPYERGDRFLLCSDGIHGTMPESELIKLISGTKPALAIMLDSLVSKVDMMGREKGGGHDNLTAVLIEMCTNSILKEKMSKRIKNLILCLSAVLLISLVFNITLVLKKRSTLNSHQLKNEVVVTTLDSLKKANLNLTMEISRKQGSETSSKIKSQLCEMEKKLSDSKKELEKLRKDSQNIENYKTSLRKIQNSVTKFQQSKEYKNNIQPVKYMVDELNNELKAFISSKENK